MPNWCENSVKIIGSKEQLQHLIDIKFDFKIIYPEPDYTKVRVKCVYPDIRKTEFADPQRAWWDWRITNWGTKWEADVDVIDNNFSKISSDKYMMIFSFNSAWTPPLGIYKKLEDTGLKVTAFYYEPGCDFLGSWKNGVDSCRRIPCHIDPFWKTIEGEELDKEFHILHDQRFENEKDFIKYAKDYIKKFNAYPTEFETVDGYIWDAQMCADFTKESGLLELIK